jgi:hypothetical protein
VAGKSKNGNEKREKDDLLCSPLHISRAEKVGTMFFEFLLCFFLRSHKASHLFMSVIDVKLCFD